jgi:hypothetical protein
MDTFSPCSVLYRILAFRCCSIERAHYSPPPPIRKPASTAGFLPYLVRLYFSIVFRLDQRQPVRVVAHTSNRGDDGALA